jgi:prepilin peptidase CpaA
MSSSADHPVSPFADSPPAVVAPGTILSWPAIWILLASVSAVVNAILVMGTQGRQGFFLPLLAMAVCLLAAFLDASTGRIPNPLTYFAMVAGLGLNLLVPLLQSFQWQAVLTWLGAPGAAASLMGFGICAGLTLLAPLLAPNGIHGGDLKLLAAVGAILGLLQTGNALIVALLVALAYALVNLACLGRLNATLRIGAARCLELFYLRRVLTPLPDDPAPADATHIPMAVPLAVGLIAAQLWQWRAGGLGGTGGIL